MENLDEQFPIDETPSNNESNENNEKGNIIKKKKSEPNKKIIGKQELKSYVDDARARGQPEYVIRGIVNIAKEEEEEENSD